MSSEEPVNPLACRERRLNVAVDLGSGIAHDKAELWDVDRHTPLGSEVNYLDEAPLHCWRDVLKSSAGGASNGELVLEPQGERRGALDVELLTRLTQ